MGHDNEEVNDWGCDRPKADAGGCVVRERSNVNKMTWKLGLQAMVMKLS